MKPFKTIEEAESYLRTQVTSGVAGDTIFLAKAMPLMLRLMKQMADKKQIIYQSTKKTRWDKFMELFTT